MTPKERAAMQQALEALELCGTDDMAYIKSEKAITALREALAERKVLTMTQEEIVDAIRSARIEQAEQEPVSLHKVVEEHIADLRACVPTLRQYPEMTSMTREVIKAANELEVALKSEQAEQEPVAFADKYGNVMKAKEKLTSTNVMTNNYDRPLYEKTEFYADLYSVAGKLALELECLMLDTKDLSVVSRWWDTAHDALEQWRSIKDTAPIRTKDLTDDEIMACRSSDPAGGSWLESARAVIAADREKNK